MNLNAKTIFGQDGQDDFQLTRRRRKKVAHPNYVYIGVVANHPVHPVQSGENLL